MASIRKTFDVAAPPAAAWDALCDFVAVDRRVAPGFVTESVERDGDRLVTFFDGARALERLVGRDHEARRLVYTVVEGSAGLTHHQATVEVLDPGPGATGSTIVWTTDLLPDGVAPGIDMMMEKGLPAIREGLAG
jgi:hypothetical protein